MCIRDRVISYKFDPLLTRYEEMELGDFSPTVTSPITKGANAGEVANTAYGKSNNAETLLQQHLKDFNNPHHVTSEQVSGGTGGGTSILHDTKAPSNDLGNDGDYYIKDELQGISDENTLLLLHGEDFTDSSIYSEQITNTGCTLSDSGKFGKAISFTNLNKLETVEQIFDINGEFTIDFWFNQREKKANATFIGGTQTGTFKIILSNGVPVFQVHGQTSYYSSFVDTQLNTWYHFALTGKNKTYSMFVDGVKKNTFTYTGNISNDILRIGLNVAQNSTGSIEGVTVSYTHLTLPTTERV